MLKMDTRSRLSKTFCFDIHVFLSDTQFSWSQRTFALQFSAASPPRIFASCSSSSVDSRAPSETEVYRSVSGLSGRQAVCTRSSCNRHNADAQRLCETSPSRPKLHQRIRVLLHSLFLFQVAKDCRSTSPFVVENSSLLALHLLIAPQNPLTRSCQSKCFTTFRSPMYGKTLHSETSKFRRSDYLQLKQTAVLDTQRVSLLQGIPRCIVETPRLRVKKFHLS